MAADVETPRGRLARRKEPKMVVDRIRTGGLLALLLLPEDSVITAAPSIALVELSVIAVVVAEVRCAFSADCDVGLSLSGTCLEKNNRATLIF